MNSNIFSMSNLTRYSELFQVIGIIGLIASLIFVGLELRQSHKIALAEQQQQRMNTFINIIMNQTISDHAHQTSAEYENEMSKRDIVRHNFWHQLWHIYEADFLRYRLGLMDENIWQSRLSIMRNGRSPTDKALCENRQAIWDVRSNQLDIEFVKLIESFPDTCKD
tara:strand:- start:75 stop:572 length:498 start_codon:yes stop_codon:yes gene_type:complete